MPWVLKCSETGTYLKGRSGYGVELVKRMNDARVFHRKSAATNCKKYFSRAFEHLEPLEVKIIAVPKK